MKGSLDFRLFFLLLKFQLYLVMFTLILYKKSTPSF